MALLHILLALTLLPLPQAAPRQLRWADASRPNRRRTDVILANFGGGDLSHTLLYKPSFVTLRTKTAINYTLTLSLTGRVGVSKYTIRVGNSSLKGKLIVAGFTLRDGNTLLSGDDAPGVAVGWHGNTTYTVDAVGISGKRAKLIGTTIAPRAGGHQPYMQEVDEARTGFSGGNFTLAINHLRVGTGAFQLLFAAPSISLLGEVFETVLHVNQSTSPPPPCVVAGTDLPLRYGVVQASMYNLLTPPRATRVRTIALAIGNRTVPYDDPLSKLALPTSTLFFRGISRPGNATLLCDGVPATVSTDSNTTSYTRVVLSGTRERLARETIGVLDSSEGTRVVATVRVVDATPETLGAGEAEGLVDGVCRAAMEKGCVLLGVRSGSAIVDVGMVAVDGMEAKERIEMGFEECEVQRLLGYVCGKVLLDGVDVERGGAARWGGVGGGAGLLLSILVGAVVWVGYVKSAEMEGSGSSGVSGPVGVPDDWEVVYEEGILRDVYGRGGLGGPSWEDKEESVRLGDLRELEMIRGDVELLRE